MQKLTDTKNYLVSKVYMFQSWMRSNQHIKQNKPNKERPAPPDFSHGEKNLKRWQQIRRNYLGVEGGREEERDGEVGNMNMLYEHMRAV